MAEIILCDTNIFVEFYRGNSVIIANLKAIGQENIATSIVVAGELKQGALNKNELKIIKNDLLSIIVYDINSEICQIFTKLIEEYSLTHGLKVADAFIAATSLFHHCDVYTLNTKDFRFIKGVKLYKP